MSSAEDFVVTGHALERMVERFPEEMGNLSSRGLAAVARYEVNQALAEGRYTRVPPIELASLNIHLHATGEGQACWTKDKRRGYIYREGEDGLVIMSVILGQDIASARESKLAAGRRRKPRSVTINLGDTNTLHKVGDTGCVECWEGAFQTYPKPCSNERCEGLVHAEFGDENYDGDYWLYTKCDICGEAE